MNNLESIKAKIIKANPFDLGENGECITCKNRYCICIGRNRETGNWGSNKDFNLEDVLMAFQKEDIPIRIDEDGEFIIYKELSEDEDLIFKWEETDIFWIFGKSLESQSEETINLLEEFLNK